VSGVGLELWLEKKPGSHDGHDREDECRDEASSCQAIGGVDSRPDTKESAAGAVAIV